MQQEGKLIENSNFMLFPDGRLLNLQTNYYRKFAIDKDGYCRIRIPINGVFKSFALKNNLSGEHTLKNQGKLPTLVGALTLEAQPIAYGVGG